ncbi:Outer membrane protein, OMP85 family [Rubellimicrobium mesophilum DSM 19309]|uniref:Outer membrane protein, OMP85 family n=1 Tax=Rubellimicrobium mesophilum DSM 19309 TaxID=442562 RepID=A0A017HP38_9RHOB|nr:BamA/TamA family outer membrane protein [Rubellimicrobium mesophilum]EYD76277.1 Outer membrane protein, OMP85 family [Rubellimicrobium mesophilum DSM 19309]
MDRLSPLLLAALLPLAAQAQEATLALPPGTDDSLRDVLEGSSLTLSLESEGLTAPQDYIAAARADYRRLLAGLYSEGYYGGVISILVDGQEAATIQPLEAPESIRQVTLNVTPGPRFTFGTTAIAPLAPATELPPAFAPGEVARSLVVEEAATAALTAWREEGNAKAQVGSEQITAVHPASRLDVAIGIVPGPELTFGDVTVSGNERVRTRRILRIAGIPTGRVFSPEDLDRAATRLRRTGAFDSVAVVESDAIGPNDTLPIELQVVESLPRRIGFGAEISSLDGLSANAFWLHRNLLGGAERLRIEGEVSDIGSDAIGTASGGTDYALGATFSRPATFSPDNDLTVSAEISQEDQEDYFLQQLTFDVGITRYATDTLTLSFALGYLAAHEETDLATRDYTLLTAPLTATWDRRDDPRDTRSGFYIDAEATPFLTLTGDTGNGARLYADARYYRSFGSRFTLAARGQLGSVFGADRGDVPQDYLFFAGGSDTVRGVPFQSVGVDLPDPETPGETVTLGGASLAGLQLEGRLGITDNIGAVAFADAAFVGEDSFSSDGDWAAGVGIGARYNTFVGPIRLDIATPATGDDAFGQVQVYIGIGQAF